MLSKYDVFCHFLDGDHVFFTMKKVCTNKDLKKQASSIIFYLDNFHLFII